MHVLHTVRVTQREHRQLIEVSLVSAYVFIFHHCTSVFSLSSRAVKNAQQLRWEGVVLHFGSVLSSLYADVCVLNT